MRNIVAHPTSDPHCVTSQVAGGNEQSTRLRAIVPKTAIAPRNVSAGETIHISLSDDDEDYPGKTMEITCPVPLVENQLYTYYTIHPTTIVARPVGDIDAGEGETSWVNVLRHPTVAGAGLLTGATLTAGFMFNTGELMSDATVGGVLPDKSC